MGKSYQNFDLIIEPKRNGGERCYQVRVEAPTGTSTVAFQFPFSQQDLPRFADDIKSLDEAKRFGGKLFKALFKAEVQGTFRSSLYEAKRNGEEHGLRVRLLLTRVPELASVPWEFLYNPSTNRFLSLSVKTPVIRYLDVSEIDPPLKINSPLRILVMVSSPYDHPQLDIEKEWHNLQEALGPLEKRGLLKLDRLPSATLDGLLHQLRQEEYHVFHFIGHGLFDVSSQDGYLILENELKKAHPVSGQRLGVLLHDEKLRMAVLNACEGARASSTDSFAGVAPSLVQQGISAVVAMQFAISDKAAQLFSREFYRALSDQYTVDAAVGEARKAIFAKDHKIEWGTPVIYLRASEKRVFDIEARGSHVKRDEVSAIEQNAWDTIGQKLSIEQKWADLQAAKLDEIEHQRQWASLYKQGRKHFDAGNWPEALDALLQLRDVTGNYRELAVLIAKVEARTGRQKAIPAALPPPTASPSIKITRRWLATSALVGLFLTALISFAIAGAQSDPPPKQSTLSTQVPIQPTLTANATVPPTVVNVGQKESNDPYPTALPAQDAIPTASEQVVFSSPTARQEIRVSASKEAVVPVVQTQAPSVITPSQNAQIHHSPTATVVLPTEIVVLPTVETSPTIGKASPTATIASPSATPQPPTATIVEPTATIAFPTATQSPPTATIVEPTATIVEPTATEAPVSATLTQVPPTMQAPTVTEAPVEPTALPTAPIEPTAPPTAVLAENTTP